MKLRYLMAKGRALLLSLWSIVLTACAVQVGGEIHSGRLALLRGNPDVALAHFHRAAQSDSTYVSDFTRLNEGVWTYVGRAYYEMGKLAEAAEALRQGLRQNDKDFIGRLYLGLVLVRAPNISTVDNSFSLQDVTYALKERVTPKRLGSLVRERGVKFVLTDDIEKDLRKHGADNELVEQIRIKSREMKRAEENTREQGIKELTRSLQEIDDWFEYMAASPQGRFWDPQGKIRSQIKTHLSMIVGKKSSSQELIGGIEWVGKAMEEEIDLARRDEQEEQRRQMQRR